VKRLKIKIPSKNLGRQRCAEGFNSGVTELSKLHNEEPKYIKADRKKINRPGGLRHFHAQ
jgi:hypothetical protein